MEKTRQIEANRRFQLKVDVKGKTDKMDMEKVDMHEINDVFRKQLDSSPLDGPISEAHFASLKGAGLTQANIEAL